MVKKTLAYVLGGGKGTRLEELTDPRSKPAVPLFGRFRILDPNLRNMVGAGVGKIYVVPQYRSRSLEDRVGVWKRFLGYGQLDTLPPQETQKSGRPSVDAYSGTADAVRKNLDKVFRYGPDRVAIFAGDHVCDLSVSEMIDAHNGVNDLTVAAIRREIKEEDFFVDGEGVKRYNFGVIVADDHGQVQSFLEKPENPERYAFDDDRKYVWSSMGNYIFDTEELVEGLTHGDDFGEQVIGGMLDRGKKIAIYPFEGYWEDIGSVSSYFRVNMELTSESPAFDIYGSNWVFDTDLELLLRPSGRSLDKNGKFNVFSENVRVYSDDVTRCVVSPDVYIGRGAQLDSCIVYSRSVIAEDTKLKMTIVDKNNYVPRGFNISPDNPNGFPVRGGIVIIPKGALKADKTSVDRVA